MRPIANLFAALRYAHGARRWTVDPRRSCAAGMHADRVYVRVHVSECHDLGTCPGHHVGLRCPSCGATWDVTSGELVRAEALR